MTIRRGAAACPLTDRFSIQLGVVPVVLAGGCQGASLYFRAVRISELGIPLRQRRLAPVLTVQRNACCGRERCRTLDPNGKGGER